MSAPVWLITGCSSSNGFGARLVEELTRRSQRVIATGKDPKSPYLSSLSTAGINVIALDVTAPLSVLRETIREAQQIYGRLDYLINNAGYNLCGTLEELDVADIEHQFATNFFGLVNVTKAVLPYMRQQRGGVIANIGSTVAWQGGPGMGMYAASKAAVSAVSDALCAEVASFGIKVCCIEPGAFRSTFLDKSKLASRKQKQNRIEAYDDTASRAFEEIIAAVDGKQQGDVVKGAAVIVDVLTNKTGRGIPERLVLGVDGHETVRGKCEQVMRSLDYWKGIATDTNMA